MQIEEKVSHVQHPLNVKGKSCCDDAVLTQELVKALSDEILTQAVTVLTAGHNRLDSSLLLFNMREDIFSMTVVDLPNGK